MSSLTKLGLLAFLLQIIAQQQNVEGVPWFGGSILGLKKMKEAADLLNELSLISNDSAANTQNIFIINQISEKIDYFADVVRSNDPGKMLSTKFEKSSLLENIEKINSKYNRMKRNCHKLLAEMKEETSTKKLFFEFDEYSGPNLTLPIISKVFSEYLGISFGLSKTPSLVKKIAAEFRNAEKIYKCLPTSARQYFFNDYWELSILEIQAYLINKFSWTIQGGENFHALKLQEENFLRDHNLRMKFLNLILTDIMSDASTEIRTCDPSYWIEGVNYEQLTRLVQGYIINEINLNTEHSCSQNCEYYKNTNVSCHPNDKNCKPNGANVLSCESDGNNDKIRVCPSKTRARHLQYFETHGLFENKHYGKSSSCQYNESTANSFILNFVFCSYCFCLIDEKSDKSDRFFNLREVVSDVGDNKVVTGVRFVKKNRIMYLQIQQGELGPNGSIKKNTIGWKDVEEYGLNAQNDGIDYFTFDNDYKSIDLSDVQILNTSYVVTGVKLSAGPSALHLEVRFTECDFQLGKLIQPNKTSEWISDYFSIEDKLPLWKENEAPHVSTLAPGKNLPSADTYDYVEFTYSNKKSDASQTTLPFFDIQDVVSRSPTALSGIGLYHRGFDGYGGFIAPKIFTPNFLPYLS